MLMYPSQYVMPLFQYARSALHLEYHWPVEYSKQFTNGVGSHVHLTHVNNRRLVIVYATNTDTVWMSLSTLNRLHNVSIVIRF